MRKKWSKFYTPTPLSELLVSSLPANFNPKNVIDICAGSCNLLLSANKRWPKANLHASDINGIKLNANSDFKVKTYCLDALDIDSMKRSFRRKSNKLILANPPFGKISFKETDSLNYPDRYNLLTSGLNRVEYYIILSNLSLLNKGDYFAAILPENVFTSDKSRAFKEFLLNCFEEIKVEHHSYKFPGSDVRTRLFIGKFVSLKVKSNYSNPNWTNPIEKSYPIIRGVDNSILVDGLPKKNQIGALHFSNSNGDIMVNKKLPEFKTNFSQKQIESKDLLICRVGRSAGTIIIPDKRHIGLIPSDLLFILRNGQKLSKYQLLEFQASLRKQVKGLTSNYIAKSDIYESLSMVLN